MGRNVASSPVEIRCKGILFDMDGILISSIGSVERSWTKWAEMRGVDPEFACKTAHGRRAIETAAMLRPDLDSEAELKLIEDIELGGRRWAGRAAGRAGDAARIARGSLDRGDQRDRAPGADAAGAGWNSGAGSARHGG